LKPGDLIWENLHVLNGVKALASLYYMYGITYYFSWYSVIENPQDIMVMKENPIFSLIPGAFFTAPVFLFLSGFL